MGKIETHLRRLAALAVLCFAFIHAQPARADAGSGGSSAGASGGSSSFDIETISDLYHITSDRTLYHTREKVKEAFGHVVVSAEGKRLACDYLWVDDNTKDIIARGNVVFVDKKSTVEAAELHFNINTGFGSIFYGRVYNDLYSMRGQLIRRVGDDHYLTTEGEYSTCKDCPESWKLAARHVDLTIDGYAFMDGVFIKVKDVPTVYLPYLIVPVKTRRQTGLLFPRVGATSSHGFVYVQPLFLAIDQHQDMTLAGGTYSMQGPRYEAQYRYKSYDGIAGQTDVFYSRDKTYQPNTNQYYPNRGAVKSTNEWPLDPHFGMRWRFFESKDRDYTYDFPEDFNFQGFPDVESNLVAQAPFDDFFVSMEVRRYMSLLYDDPVDFDTGVVQDAPAVHFGIKDRKIAGPVLARLYGRFDNFTRGNGPIFDGFGTGVFDTNFSDPNNLDRIREARRLMVTPELSAPFSLGRYFAVAPGVQFTDMSYHFPVAPPNLVNQTDTNVSFLRTYLNVSTVFERVYDYNGDTVSKVKHQMVPFIQASFIPKVQQDPSHPFEQQIQLSDGPFDQFDLVPLTNSTNYDVIPQGKSLYYGFSSRVVRKKKRPDEMPRAYPYDLLPAAKPKDYPRPYNRKQADAIEAEKLWDEHNPNYNLYQEAWDFSVSNAYDFLAAHDHAGDPKDNKYAFSYILAKSDLNIDDKFTQGIEYKYYPSLVFRPSTITQPTTYFDKQMFTTNFTWYWKKLANLRKTRFFERSMSFNWSLDDQPTPGRTIGATLTWSFNDFMSVHGEYGWDLNAQAQNNIVVNAMLTHPSECWGIAFHWDWQRSRQPNAGEIGFQLLLNIDGSGFMGAKGQAAGGAGSMFGGS